MKLQLAIKSVFMDQFQCVIPFFHLKLNFLKDCKDEVPGILTGSKIPVPGITKTGFKPEDVDEKF